MPAESPRRKDGSRDAHRNRRTLDHAGVDVGAQRDAVDLPDESLAFNEMGDHQQRLEDLGAGRIATMDAQGIDVSILALTPPGTQPLPAEGCRASEPCSERRCGGDRQPAIRPDSIAVHAAHVVTTGCRRRA